MKRITKLMRGRGTFQFLLTIAWNFAHDKYYTVIIIVGPKLYFEYQYQYSVLIMLFTDAENKLFEC
jgi:hypothetical protein